MDNILDILVEAITMDNMCHNELNTELEREAEEAMKALYEWVQSSFPELKENDLAYDRIQGAMYARERWMLKNGIVIGMRLAAEGLISG